MIGDDVLKIIKSFSYMQGEDANDWYVVMDKVEKYCIGEVNEIYERYLFYQRDKFLIELVDSFVIELKTLFKICNFCDCLWDSLICDYIVFGIKNEQITKKFLRMRDFMLNCCIDECYSEEVLELQMKLLLGFSDDINQVKLKNKKF